MFGRKVVIDEPEATANSGLPQFGRPLLEDGVSYATLKRLERTRTGYTTKGGDGNDYGPGARPVIRRHLAFHGKFR